MQYIYRPKGTRTKDRKTAAPSLFHIPDDSGMSVCGKIEAGKDGYQMVTTDKKKLNSTICHNCRTR